MKFSIAMLFCLASITAFGQITKAPFDGSKWDAPYTLNVPKGWNVERFLIPIEFAPSIPYTGVEDIRFTPGWGDAKSEEYWSYAFLWYLDNKPELNASTVEQNLTVYYTGLVGRNIGPRNIPASKLFPVKTNIQAVTAANGDIKTFQGTVYMLDYMEQHPITLNCIVHLQYCPGKPNSFVFTEISPKPYAHKVWQSFSQLWNEFSCDRTAGRK